MTSEPDAGLKTSFYLLMVYAALIGALSSLITAGYITLYNQGIKFFEQVSLLVLNVDIWPLVLLTGAGVLIGLLIKFFGSRGGIGGCPAPVCPDRPPKPQGPAQYLTSRVHIVVEWGPSWS
jgi:hypothetical protein